MEGGGHGQGASVVVDGAEDLAVIVRGAFESGRRCRESLERCAVGRSRIALFPARSELGYLEREPHRP